MSEIEQHVSGHGNIFSGTGDVRVNIVESVSPVEREERRGLTTLLEKVKHFWIQGVLENSVYNSTLIDLGKRFLPETVVHPWEAVLELPDQTSQMLDASQNIASLFDDVGRALLILGEPGAGKTTSLLELASGLVRECDADATCKNPVPVVLNLVTWSSQRQPLFDWLVAELTARYQIPSRFSTNWLKRQRLFLLLDGLDEVSHQYRAACVEAVNAFVREVGVPGIVVCSRRSEYTSLPVRLSLNAAICLQPLSMPQVQVYLEEAGAELSVLKALILEDHDLQVLAQTPLMLNMMILSYRNLSIDDFKQQRKRTLEERRQHLISSYIERMFRRKGKAAQPYTRLKVLKWLAWLSEKMTRHSQNAFHIDNLQPSWLDTRWQRTTYALASRSMFVFFFVLLFCCGMYASGFLSSFFENGVVPYGVVPWAMLAMLVLAGPFGLVLGLVDLVMLRRFEEVNKSPKKSKILKPLLVYLSLFGLTVFLIFLVPMSMVTVNVYFPAEEVGSAAEENIKAIGQPSAEMVSPIETQPQKENGQAAKIAVRRRPSGTDNSNGQREMPTPKKLITTGISSALPRLTGAFTFGLLIGFTYWMRMRRRGLARDVQVTEALGWSWNGAWKGALFGVLLGPLIVYLSTQEMGISINIYFDQTVQTVGESVNTTPGLEPFELMRVYLPVSIILLLFGMLVGGIKRDAIPIKTQPNQGILLTLRNAGFIGLMLGLICALVTIWVRSVLTAFVAGLTAALITMLCYGGVDVFQHYLLRVILAAKRYAPLNYPRLLEHTTRLILTQKVGGGYIFIHRFVLEHFAAMRQQSRLEG